MVEGKRARLTCESRFTRTRHSTVARLTRFAKASSTVRRIAPGRVFVLGALILAGILTILRPAWAVPFDLSGSDWEGCSELVRLARGELGAARVMAVTRLDFSELRPEDGLLLLYPEGGLDVDELSRFMGAGGRVILLDDFGRGDTLLAHFKMERVPTPSHPLESLRHNPQFALAEPASAHPVVSDVSRVVTNHPTGLVHKGLSPVLKIRAADDSDVVIAVAGAVGQGRLLAVGDPSIVMNSMLRYNGNKAFARGIIRYAVDNDSWGKRGGRLFIATGGFEQKGSYGSDDNTLGDLIRAAREALEATRREGAPKAFAYALAIALGLGLWVWVGSRAGRLHKPIVPRFVRRIPTVAQGGVAGHAAVIAAPQTTRVLAILELKSALEEQLTTILRLSQVPGHQELIARVEQEKLLSPEGMHTLRRLLLRMSNVETMVVSARNGSPRGTVQAIRDQEVVATAKSVRQLLEMAETNARTGFVPSEVRS
ncbi:hypothetical protein AKJ09_06120 [Labilithrix luteola]|uniref:DUF4350 domain-containing protein n=2 Tax=Labilithrix luteola TaxID=1391654 RepID=A0A0K1Q1E4_9BACT|nr:hypothetical protein AKJ09_06120 [Labilithrix luteola]